MSSKKDKKQKKLEAAAGAATTAPPGTEVAPVLNESSLELVVRNIQTGVAISTAKGESLTVAEVVEEYMEGVNDLLVKSRGLLIGATPEMVYVEFVNHLAAARYTEDYATIITCGVFAVSVAYSTSESWVKEYELIDTPHMFQNSEIESREAVKATTTKKAVNWVANSKMNAHFIRIFGNMIVCAARNDGFLKKLGERAGTFLNPPPEADKKERSVLMNAALAEMQESDKKVIREFAADFGKYADVVSYMFGEAGGDIEKSQKAIKAMNITYI